MLRKVLFWTHLTTALMAGVVIFIMSVTGVALTYQKQTTEWADRAYWPEQVAAEGEPISTEELIARVSAESPEASQTSIRFYSDPAAPAVVSGDGGTVYINRYTGEITSGQSESIRAFFRLMTDWHRWLADDTRSWGRAMTGASNLGFLLVVLTGMYIWIPRSWNPQSLRNVTLFRGGLHGKARDFNWHNVFGFWTALPLVLVVASGAVISYPWATNLVYTLTGTEAPARGGGGSGSGAGDLDRMEEPVLALSDVDRFLDSVAEAVPGWRTIDMTLPAATDRRVDFRIDESFGGQPQSRTTLSINRHTGDIVGMTTFDDQNTGQRARSWLRFVHTGEYYGMIGQTIAGIASLAGAFLVYTGFALSIRRFYAWRGRR